MWSAWGFAVSERACLNQCTALWYLWYQSSRGSGGMQPLFPRNHNASGNVLSCSSNLGLFCDWTLVIRTLCWQAVLFHSIHFSIFSSTQLTIKSFIAFCTQLGILFYTPPTITDVFSWLRKWTFSWAFPLANKHAQHWLASKVKEMKVTCSGSRGFKCYTLHTKTACILKKEFYLQLYINSKTMAQQKKKQLVGNGAAQWRRQSIVQHRSITLWMRTILNVNIETAS